MNNPMSLTDRLILVTGASSGIGRATAVILSQLGARVILLARNEEKLQKTMELLEGEGHRYFTVDLGVTDSIEPLLKQIVKDCGPVSGLAYCAGIGSYPQKTTKKEKLLDVMNINFFGFVEMCRILSNRRMRTEKASFVGVSSLSSKRGEGGMTAYCSSKAAMDGAVRAMAHELAPSIRVNTVQPGWTDTEMFHSVIEQNGTGRFDKELEVMQYLGLVKPEGIAHQVAFLLSDASEFITGSSIGVDGGYFS